MPDTLDALRADLAALTAVTGGTFGIYFEDLADGETLAINADLSFPAASVIKVPLLVHLMTAASRGEIDLDAPLDLDLSGPDFSTDNGGSGVLVHLRSRLGLSMRDLITLAIIVSDNVATNILTDRVGFDAINVTLDALGLTQTRYNRRIEDWPTLRQPGSNPATPAEIGHLYRMIYCRELPHSDEILRILKAQQFGSRLPYFLPMDDEITEVAHKSGSLNGLVHDGGLMMNPKFNFVLIVFSSGQTDSTAAALTLARLSRRVYDYARAKAEGEKAG